MPAREGSVSGLGAGEMAQGTKGLAAHTEPEDLNLSPPS